MPNHFHFLIKVKSDEEIVEFLKSNMDSKKGIDFIQGKGTLNELISDQYRRLNSSFSLKYNHKHQLRGQLFLNKHKRIEIDMDEKFEYIWFVISITIRFITISQMNTQTGNILHITLS